MDDLVSKYSLSSGDVMEMKSLKVNDDFNVSNDALGMKEVVEAFDNNFDNKTSAELKTNLLNQDLSCWGYWRDYYYPYVIRESYPVYIKEQAQDQGKKAFEIIKMLKDKKLIKITTIGQFIDMMDELIKIL